LNIVRRECIRLSISVDCVPRRNPDVPSEECSRLGQLLFVAPPPIFLELTSGETLDLIIFIKQALINMLFSIPVLHADLPSLHTSPLPLFAGSTFKISAWRRALAMATLPSRVRFAAPLLYRNSCAALPLCRFAALPLCRFAALSDAARLLQDRRAWVHESAALASFSGHWSPSRSPEQSETISRACGDALGR
jgi:hypothetical protein